jgi:hypothetical protein
MPRIDQPAGRHQSGSSASNDQNLHFFPSVPAATPSFSSICIPNHYTAKAPLLSSAPAVFIPLLFLPSKRHLSSPLFETTIHFLKYSNICLVSARF